MNHPSLDLSWLYDIYVVEFWVGKDRKIKGGNHLSLQTHLVISGENRQA